MPHINLDISQVEIRENRLGSITGFIGTAEELVTACRSGRLQDGSRDFTQCMGCNASHAFCQLAMIKDVAVVNHAPIGCSGNFFGMNFVYKFGQLNRGALKAVQGRYFNTNIDEGNVVFGASDKLRATIQEAYERVHPKAIFITSSCASGIIGEDIDAIAAQAAEELKIPVVYCSCEGFRTKIWTTGFDAAYHAIMRGIVKPPRERKKVINVINFWGSHSFDALFHKLGYQVQYLVPFTSVENLQYISEATATVQICNTLGTYLAQALEQEYGVKAITAPAGYGLTGTDIWAREIGRVLGHEKEVEEWILEERRKVLPQLEKYKTYFKGKKAYVTAGAAHGHALISMLRDLGFTVDGVAIFHHDPQYDYSDNPSDSDALEQIVKHSGDIKHYNVCGNQDFEILNALLKAQPDVVVSRHGGVGITAAKLGIPSLPPMDEQFIFGYEGILHFALKLHEILEYNEFVKFYANHTNLPYTKWWIEQNPYSYLKNSKIKKL